LRAATRRTNRAARTGGDVQTAGDGRRPPRRDCRRPRHLCPAGPATLSVGRRAGAGRQTDTEKAGLQYVLDHPGTNYYGSESLGGRHYFTAVYAEVATVNACADCHNQNPASPKKDFKTGDVMGGLVVRVPLEF
jgi:hypothetical protein